MIKHIIIVILSICAVGMTVYLIFGQPPYNPAPTPMQTVRKYSEGRYIAIEESQFERLIMALEQIAYNQQHK